MTRRFLLSLLLISSSIAANAQHWRIKPTPEELAYRAQYPQPQPVMPAHKTTANTWTMPPDAWIPGEYEESQAVALAWVYDYMPPFAIDVSSTYANIWGDMAAAIQLECAVWIRITSGADSNTIKTFMANRGTPLTNYRFHVMIADDFWIRDFGPLGFYHGANDEIGFVDMNYYPGRDNDNLYPELLANELSITNVRTNLYAEGGNFITDGFGNVFHSSVITSVNKGNNPAHGPWTGQQVKDTIQYAWAAASVTETPTLQCDGGTGHNDMFMKLTDEQTFAVMEYPTVVTAQDKNIINNVINTLTTAKSVYNKPYRIFKLPMPTQDNGNYLTSCAQINNDARTFVNGLTVNKTYIMPSYSNTTSGNKPGDDAAVEIFKRYMPGYKIVPIDSRDLTILGGALHCVTMQIPADNPVRFWHPAIVDLQPLANTYHIVAEITNKSGIASAICKWRVKGTTNWNTVNLTDSSGFMIGDITGTFSTTDQVEYYLSATTNNSKTMTKPIAAADGGYYTFYFQWPGSVGSLDPNTNFAMNPLPNPTTGSFFIPVSVESPMQLTATLTDVFGKTITVKDFGKNSGMQKLEFDISNAPAGMYYVHIFANDILLGTKKIVLQ